MGTCNYLPTWALSLKGPPYNYRKERGVQMELHLKMQSKDLVALQMAMIAISSDHFRSTMGPTELNAWLDANRMVANLLEQSMRIVKAEAAKTRAEIDSIKKKMGVE